MNGLSDSVTIGIVLALVFGALFFYLYSRLTQNEKRVSLIENMLIDLKMTIEGSWIQGHSHEDEQSEEENVVSHIEPVSAPEPLKNEDVDVNEEDIYKEVLSQSKLELNNDSEPEMKQFDISNKSISSTSKPSTLNVTKVQPNYESMSSKELKNLIKSRGLTISSAAGKKEIISVLRKADGTTSASIEGGSFVSANEGAMLDENLGEVETL